MMGLFAFIARILDLYSIVIVVYVVLSWIVMVGGSRIVSDLYRALATICEPYLGIFRRVLPPLSAGSVGLDLAPLLGLLVLQIVSGVIGRLG